MKILLYDMGSYIQKDLIFYLKKAGCTCRNVLYKCIDRYSDPFFEKEFFSLLKDDTYDVVISTNFFPIVAKICFQANIKYLSWSYDSPIDTSCIEYYQYPTSYSFFFDRMDVAHLQSLGVKNVFHLPLAVNTYRLNHVIQNTSDVSNYTCDISFLGQFYENSLSTITSLLGDYDKGFIDALIQTQLRVYGYNFLEEVISDELMTRINTVLHSHNVSVELTPKGLKQSIEKEITRIERLILLQTLGDTYHVKYYSVEKPAHLKNCQYGGSAFYFTEMPQIFYNSKINLCPTLRSIESGIPLRALDILGSHGVLLSNYQPELCEYFTDGVDIITYDSLDDAIYKADFYLNHENLRSAIAENGYQKVASSFTYPERIKTMFQNANIL